MVGLGRQVLKPEAHGRMFYSALKLGQGYNMLSRAREKDSDCNGDGGIVTKECEGEKKTVFKIDGFLLHYTQ